MTTIYNPYRYAVVNSNASRSFDGINDEILINAAPVTAAPLTLAAWVKLDDTANIGGIMSIGDNNASGQDVDEFSITQVANSFWAITKTGSLDVEGSEAKSTATSFSTGVWYHVAGVFASSTSRKIYINGDDEIVENTEDFTPDTPNMDVVVIGDRTGVDQFHDGLISDCRLYNRALSDQEVLDLSNLTHVSSGLVGWWKLDETGANPTFTDYGSGGNDGTNDGTAESTDGPSD